MSLSFDQAAAGITDDQIAERAYLIWQARGCPEGDGSDNWEQAKRELIAEAKRTIGPLRRLIYRLRNRAAM